MRGKTVNFYGFYLLFFIDNLSVGLSCVTRTPFASRRPTIFNIVFDVLFLFPCLFFSRNYLFIS